MSFNASGPGKTAPKLFHDILRFDPLKTSSNANILTDFNPPVGEGPQISTFPGSCKHEYATKSSQSLTPPLDLRPDGGTQYKVALVCKKCRIHADVDIKYGNAWGPCPTPGNPLHHFQRIPTEDVRSQSRITYVWQCSWVDCNASLEVTYKLQKLTDGDRNLLTNTELLKARYDDVVADAPSREGIRQATPIDAVHRLRKYIKDSLNPAHTKRTFPSNNKRFMEAFGVDGRDCQELLERLGFTYDDHTWTLPDPPAIDNRLRADGSSPRELLEDVEMELLALAIKIAAETTLVNPAALEGWPAAERDIERTLAAQGYQRHVTLKRATAVNELLPYFSSLGALPDFHDSLIEFAFDRQFACDPQQVSYYFECLQIITESRGSELLQVKVATLSSQDFISRRDLFDAYKVLHLDRDMANSFSDDRIVDKFHAVQSDLGPQAQEHARQALYKIGTFRASSRLINASQQTLETYEDALMWLGNGVDKETADEALLAVATIKIEDNPTNKEVAQKAISVINQTRKSNQLNDWLLTGQAGGYIMGVEEALRILGIEQSFDSLDTHMLSYVFDIARKDRPGDMTERAIATIEERLKGSPTSTHSPETWPVGLTSHGNTCYLNSLLQYYFSIQALRDIVLNYDQYKLDTTKVAEKAERVGRRISMLEIKGGQRFADDLKHLFERMIKDQGPHVKPEEDLVCRAFLDPKEYAQLADRSSEGTKTGELESAVEDTVSETPIAIMNPVVDDEKRSDSSGATLLGDEDNDTIMKDAGMPPTPPASPGRKPSPLAQAPSLPPRRFSTAKEEALRKAQENAKQQQDVTEVHDGVMFRLRSGMTPQGADESGEQLDSLRQLFSIGLYETSVKDGVDGERQTLVDTSVQLDVPYEDTDIYSALDAVFDLQAYGENIERYKSIKSLPPLLQVSTPRIGFREGTPFKSAVQMKLEDELFLDRYIDELDAEILPKRKACWGWRMQLRSLKKEQEYLKKAHRANTNLPEDLSVATSYLDSLASAVHGLENVVNGDASLSSAIEQDATEQNERLATLQSQIDELSKKLNGVFEPHKNVKYRLAAVFFHRGNTNSGHYWICIHDFANNVWRKYNDEHVEEFTKLNELFQAKEYNDGTPTYAVYVRDEQKLNYIVPVCRAPEKPPTPEPIDELPPLVRDNDTQSNEPPSRQPQPQTVEPKLVEDETSGDWDVSREVVQTKW